MDARVVDPGDAGPKSTPTIPLTDDEQPQQAWQQCLQEKWTDPLDLPFDGWFGGQNIDSRPTRHGQDASAEAGGSAVVDAPHVVGERFADAREKRVAWDAATVEEKLLPAEYSMGSRTCSESAAGVTYKRSMEFDEDYEPGELLAAAASFRRGTESPAKLARTVSCEVTAKAKRNLTVSVPDGDFGLGLGLGFGFQEPECRIPAGPEMLHTLADLSSPSSRSLLRGPFEEQHHGVVSDLDGFAEFSLQRTVSAPISSSAPGTCRFPGGFKLASPSPTRTRASFASPSLSSPSFSVIVVKLANGETRFECSLCESRFTQKYNLTKHVRSVHDCVRRFACDLCASRFKQKDHLRKHMAGVHRMPNAKPVVCTVCPESFVGDHALQEHMKEVHSLEPHAKAQLEGQASMKQGGNSPALASDDAIVDMDGSPHRTSSCGSGKNASHLHSHSHSSSTESDQSFQARVPAFTESRPLVPVSTGNEVLNVNLNGQDALTTPRMVCTECNAAFANRRAVLLHQRRMHHAGENLAVAVERSPNVPLAQSTSDLRAKTPREEMTRSLSRRSFHRPAEHFSSAENSESRPLHTSGSDVLERLTASLFPSKTESLEYPTERHAMERLGSSADAYDSFLVDCEPESLEFLLGQRTQSRAGLETSISKLRDMTVSDMEDGSRALEALRYRI
ncbi:Hypermethylated in cancer 1 protein [Porphyridium purpureum]|uniref:Hypermethylated in cancer 1 protein n=1 Tax=Porphyridium purpureum TaxID=35688 RepID=A0A5J4YVE3_PORPP|nr:Hypermethylated in cancer 1 protein [Porphyridium purpureum]|eukprot:POR2342..scf209_3